MRWIKEVSGKSETQIIRDLKDYIPDVDTLVEQDISRYTNTSTLPKDSINLSDSQQLSFYRNNDVMRSAQLLIKNRRLDTAVNRCDMYISLTDPVHKNRLIIPFKNERGEIEFYQSRTVLDRDNKTKPKYLGKVGAEKTLFNIDKIDYQHDTVYIFEGPINAFFTKNSLAVAGITERGKSFTERQAQQLDTSLRFHDRIWVLDSQWIDRASLIKTEALLKQGEQVFIWPEKYGVRFKDFNDIVLEFNLDEIGQGFIHDNTYTNLEGIVKLTQIKQYANRGQQQ